MRNSVPYRDYEDGEREAGHCDPCDSTASNDLAGCRASPLNSLKANDESLPEAKKGASARLFALITERDERTAPKKVYHYHTEKKAMQDFLLIV